MVENYKMKGKTFAENDVGTLYLRVHMVLGVGNQETIFLLSTIRMQYVTMKTKIAHTLLKHKPLFRQ